MATSWRKLITQAMQKRNETWDDYEASTLSIGELDTVFDASFGSNDGIPFTLWTKAHVYFPTDHDGRDGVRSVPRDPCPERTEHVGGGGFPTYGELSEHVVLHTCPAANEQGDGSATKSAAKQGPS